MNKKFIGFSAAVTAAVTFGLNPLFGLKLYAENLTVPTVLFYRFFLAALMVGILMLIQKKSFVLPKTHILMNFFLAACLAGTSLGLFFSFQKMDAGIASTILFTYPVIVVVIMSVFFREKLNFYIVLGILLSLAGVIVLCKTSGGAVVSIAGLSLALLSAAAYAVYIVIVKQTRLHELQAETITFYALLFSLPFFMLTPGYSVMLPCKMNVMINLALLAFLPGFISLYLTAVGLKYIGATQTAILGALEPLTAVCIGIFIFKEAFTIQLAIGIILIITAVTIVICTDKSNAKC